MKFEGFSIAEKDKYYVQAVFEDNTKCVNMYRELGLMCLQNNEDNI